MRILALDLAWVGPSGWVVWDTEASFPIEDYGQIQPRDIETDHYPLREHTIATSLRNLLSGLIVRHEPDYIAYERSDWYQDLRKASNYAVAYARERTNQRTLYSSQTVLMLAIAEAGWDITNVYDLGVSEARKEFGVGNKKAAAERISDEFPRFEFRREAKKKLLRDTETGKLLDDHISDAIVIASVQAARLRRWQMIDQVLESSA